MEIVHRWDIFCMQNSKMCNVFVREIRKCRAFSSVKFQNACSHVYLKSLHVKFQNMDLFVREIPKYIPLVHEIPKWNCFVLKKITYIWTFLCVKFRNIDIYTLYIIIWRYACLVIYYIYCQHQTHNYNRFYPKILFRQVFYSVIY